MKVDKGQCNHASRKRGRRGNIAANRDRILALGPIETIDCAALNNINWFSQSYGYLINLRYPEKGYRSGLTPAMESHIEVALEALRNTPLGKFYIESDAAQQELPDLQLRGIRLERAVQMSHALLRIARRDRDLVRRVVLGYCLAVSDRMRVEFTDIRDAKRGRELVKLVKNLRLPWLGIRPVGYSLGAEKAIRTSGSDFSGSRPRRSNMSSRKINPVARNLGTSGSISITSNYKGAAVNFWK